MCSSGDRRKEVVKMGLHGGCGDQWGLTSQAEARDGFPEEETAEVGPGVSFLGLVAVL